MDTYVDYILLNEKRYISNLLEDNRLHIFGAGNYGKKTLDILGGLAKNIDKVKIYDNDNAKWGTVLQNHEVNNPDEMEDDLVLVLAIFNLDARKDIEKQLRNKGNYKFISFFALELWKVINDDPKEINNQMRYISAYQKWMFNIVSVIQESVKKDILVYSIGKTGSTTLSQALDFAGTSSRQIHYFFFNKIHCERSQIIFPQELQRYFNFTPYFASDEYKSQIKKLIRGKKIITLIREPISQEISHLLFWVGSVKCQAFLAQKNAEGYSFEESLMQMLPYFQNEECQWFDTELSVLCDINIYDYPFDREKGWSIIEKDKTEILLMKTEKLSENIDIIKEFVQNENIELINRNIGEENPYSHIYKEFKNRIIIPEDYLDFYYNDNPWMDYFYTKEEQILFRKKWSKL